MHLLQQKLALVVSF